MKIDLKGVWKILLDRDGSGENRKLQSQTLPTVQQIHLPASLNEAGIGDIPTLDTHWTGSIYDRSWFHDPELKSFRESQPPHFPFWLTPLKYYAGVAWYEREIEISETQVGIPFRIRFERPHWQTRLWLDGVELGSCNSLCTPHVFECPGVDHAGIHRLTLRLDNAVREINPGPDAHSITDHTQGNWNGVVGRMELEFLPAVEIASVQLHPDLELRFLNVSGLLRGNGAIRGNLSVQIASLDGTELASLQTCVATQSIYHCFELQLSMAQVEAWDEFNPVRYSISVRFISSDGSESLWSEPHGFRNFGRSGTRFTINGRALFLRGNVDCCIFPATGYPPMDVDAWVRYFERLRESGFNHIRFHSWCPPKAAFVAADQIGFYLQAEAPTWPNHGVSLGDGNPVEDFIYLETERILEAYGNHASLCMLASGNEPYGSNQVQWLGNYVRYWSARDNRQLYTGASVGTKWPIVPDGEFIVHSQPRGLPFESERPHSLFDYRKEIEGWQMPFVAHEMGQFCVFPDFEEINAYAGVFRAKNLEMFRTRFLERFDPNQAREFLIASGKLQLLCYKAEIEAAWRTPGFAGIQLLGANDFPGQGTALIGWLNAFYQPKVYADIAGIQKYLAPTVLLARTDRYVYTNADQMHWELEVAHFGQMDRENVVLEWILKHSETGSTVASGEIACDKICSGTVSAVGEVSLELNAIPAPAKYTFCVEFEDARNAWDVWIYPTVKEEDPGQTQAVAVIREWSEEQFTECVEAGRDILLLAGKQIENGKDVVQYFRPAFWNTSWFQMSPPHTLGLSIDAKHPVFEEFPTDSHSDYQWWELVQGQPVANLEYFPKELRPMVQPIDTWFINRRLGMLFEFKIGRSRVVMCTCDLKMDPKRPVASQLYQSVLKYMSSPSFGPTLEVGRETVTELFEQKARKVYDVMTAEKPEELIPVITKGGK